MNLTLIDGRSGSGKTSYAAVLAADSGAEVVHMDDLYEGWHGLADGSDYLVTHILEPRARGERALWRAWDWHAHRRSDQRTLEAEAPLIVEGCGALTLASASFATHTIWLDAPEAVRRARALGRDGDDDWWELWREQEDRHIALHNPAALANERIETAPYGA